MAASIREEIRRLHRRKQLNFYPGHDVHGTQESSSDGAMDSPGSPTTSSFATTYSSSTKEKPLFTFRQVNNELFYSILEGAVFLCVLMWSVYNLKFYMTQFVNSV